MLSKQRGGHRDTFSEIPAGPQSTDQSNQGDPAKGFMVRLTDIGSTPSFHSKHHHEAYGVPEDRLHWG